MKMKKLFSRKPKYQYDFGGFIVDMYSDERNIERCYAEIRCRESAFQVRIDGYSYMYLMACAEKGNKDNIHGFCTIMYYVGSMLFTEQGFADDVMRAINKYSKRLEKKASEKSKGVSQEAEDIEDLFMRSAIERGKMSAKESKKERKRIIEEAKKDENY